MTNGWVHTQTDTREIENLVNLFMLLAAGPCSDTLSVSFCISISVSRSFSPTHGSLSCQRCWQDVCDEGSGWRVCYVNYCHNIHQRVLRIHHLFATGDSDAVNAIHLGFMLMPKTLYIMWWPLFFDFVVETSLLKEQKVWTMKVTVHVIFIIWALICSHASSITGEMATLGNFGPH